MKAPVRFLNAKGLGRFQEYLQKLREGDFSPPPVEILTDTETSMELPQTAEVEKKDFASRLDAGRYFTEALKPVGALLSRHHRGIWSWLSLFYFDQVCPLQTDGERFPGRDYRHIPETGFGNRHRHLIAGAYSVFRLHGEEGRLLLASPLHRENKFHHEIAGRQSLFTNPNIVKALDMLYFDRKNRRPKRTAQNPGVPGCLLRFIDVIQQLDLTYDLHSISTGDLVSLLPREFKNWKEN